MTELTQAQKELALEIHQHIKDSTAKTVDIGLYPVKSETLSGLKDAGLVLGFQNVRAGYCYHIEWDVEQVKRYVSEVCE